MTSQDIFNRAMDLMSEKLDSGAVDTTSTANYKVRALGILTMLQNEICRISPIYDKLTITASGTSGYVKVTLPANYLMIYQMLDKDLELFEDYKVIGEDIYVPYDFSGTLVYRYIPAEITDINDDIAFNDIISNVLVNGLAGQLLLTENETLADYFNQRYEELKNDIKTRQPSSIVKRKDLYDSSCRF